MLFLAVMRRTASHHGSGAHRPCLPSSGHLCFGMTGGGVGVPSGASVVVKDFRGGKLQCFLEKLACLGMSKEAKRYKPFQRGRYSRKIVAVRLVPQSPRTPQALASI